MTNAVETPPAEEPAVEMTKWRQLREGLDLTQMEVAKELGIPQNTWSRWERGEMRVQHPMILELALEALRRQRPQPQP